MQLKSRLLTLLVDGADSERLQAFARDIKLLMDMDGDTRRVCLEALPGVRGARSTGEFKRLVEELSNKLPKLPRHHVELVLRAANLLVDGLISDEIPKGDEALWADDLIGELQWLNDSRRGDFEEALRRLQNLIPQFDATERAERTRGGVLPTFKSLGITVEMRAIRKDYYRWDSPVSDYRPEVLGVVGVASVHIGLDSGHPKDVYFQAGEDDIDHIICSLQATRKDMASLRAHLKLDEAGTAQ